MLLPKINDSLSVSPKDNKQVKDIINDENSRTEKTLILETKKNKIKEKLGNSSVFTTKVDVSYERLHWIFITISKENILVIHRKQNLL
jgi:hypothetical protein